MSATLTPRTRTILMVACALLLLAFGFVYGVISARRRNRPARAVLKLAQLTESLTSPPKVVVERRGAWAKVSGRAGGPKAAQNQQEALGKLEALPYLQGYSAAPAVDNVTVHDEGQAYAGLTFVNSADSPNASLIDMKGKVLHSWRKDFTAVWPEERRYPADPVYKTFWRRAHLLDNGEVLAIYMDHGLVKLDRDSKVLWAYQGRAHHDLFIDPDGRIYVLNREMRTREDLRLESWRTNNPVLEDVITILGPDGKELKNISVVDCFLNSDYAPMLEHIKGAPDILHTNSIKAILADRPPLFKRGQVLISMREIHALAVVDLDSEKVVWAATGLWKYQHEPWLLDNGNVLLFDNRGAGAKSRALEIDPVRGRIAWSYSDEKFYSREAGAIQRLPNGNTLITESERGRGFEVTRDGKVVWEFVNPHRAGEQKELIAALYDVVRIPRARADWLGAAAKN